MLILVDVPGRIILETILRVRQFHAFLAMRSASPQTLQGERAASDGVAIHGRNSLEIWLEKTCRSEASDPRDFIYALLGISADCVNGEIVHDYDLPVEAVFRQVEKLVFKARSAFGVGLLLLAEKLGLNYGANDLPLERWSR